IMNNTIHNTLTTLFNCYHTAPRHLHSFPTRRSSDLERLQLRDFRCFESADLEFDPSLTWIVGPNASGKTSLLEAIYFLGHGRSLDRKSTRLNSSHVKISYAVFCLKKKKII